MPAGRPSKFDKGKAAAIIEAVADGLSLEVAAKCGRVCYNTFRRWMIAGENGENEELSQFWRDIKNAEADAEREAVRSIRAAGRDSWQAWAWWLERKYHKRWGRRERLEHSGKTQHDVNVTGEASSLPTREELLSRLADRAVLLPGSNGHSNGSNGHTANGNGKH